MAIWQIFKSKTKADDLVDKWPVFSYADLEIISDVSSSMLDTLALNKLLNNAISKIVKKLNLLGGLVFLVEDNVLYPRTVAGGQRAVQFLRLIGQPITSLRLELNAKYSDNLIVKSVLTKTPQVSAKVEDFTKHLLSSNAAGIAQMITGTKSGIVLPILHGDDTIGGVYVAKSTKGEFQAEMPLLKLLCHHLGIAITNARLYESMENLSKELEERNSELKNALDAFRELRRQEKDMLDVMGHELRTPITVVQGVLEVMDKLRKKTGKIEGEKLDRYLNLALNSTRKEVALIETLLSATKVESKQLHLQRERVDMLQLVKHSIEIFKEIANSKGISLKLDATNQKFFAYVDEIRTQEVLDNLISNAIKYTLKGYVEVNLSYGSSHIEIGVKDTGIGIEKADLKNLGKKFYRARSNGSGKDKDFVRPGGTGLGLYVAYRLVSLMGGVISVDSTVGKGTKFVVTLPLYQGPNMPE